MCERLTRARQLNDFKWMDLIRQPVDCDLAPRPVMISAAGFPSRATIPAHCHRRAEFVYVVSGRLSVTMDDVGFIASAGSAVLIPPGAMHEVQTLCDTTMMTLYIVLPRDMPQLATCRVIVVSDLLRELMQAALDVPAAYENHSRDERIMDLMREEVAWLAVQSPMPGLKTPMPQDARLARLCRQLLSENDPAVTLDDAASNAGMGRRTFTRRFRAETGMSFSDWLLRVRLNSAVGRLMTGASITEAAFDAGYSSPSAFAKLFKRAFGMPPSELLPRTREGALHIHSSSDSARSLNLAGH